MPGLATAFLWQDARPWHRRWHASGRSGSASTPQVPRSGSRRRSATQGLSWWPVPIRACCRRQAKTKSSNGVPATPIGGMRWRSVGSCIFLQKTVRAVARPKCRRRRGCWHSGNRLRTFVAKVFPRSRVRASTAPLSTTASQRTATGQSGRTKSTLLTSGAQYLDGTTDITRTFWTGPGVPPQALREQATRVLKGHINIATLVFPRGVGGAQY